MLGRRGNMGKTTSWHHFFLGSGGIAKSISCRVRHRKLAVALGRSHSQFTLASKEAGVSICLSKSMEDQKYMHRITSFWSLFDSLIVKTVIGVDRLEDLHLILALEDLQTLNIDWCLQLRALPNLLYGFGGLHDLNKQNDCPRLEICVFEILPGLDKLRLKGIQFTLASKKAGVSIYLSKSMEEHKYMARVTSFWSLFDSLIVKTVIGVGKLEDLHLILALEDLHTLNIDWCLQLRALPNLLYDFGGLHDLNKQNDCPRLEMCVFEILPGLDKLRLKGIQIKELFGIGYLDMCKHVWKSTYMFEVAPCEQHELLSNVLSFTCLMFFGTTQYLSITTRYLEDLEIKHMDLMNLALKYFCTWDIHWPLNFHTMARLDQKYQLLFKCRILASDGALELEHCLLALKGVMDMKLGSEELQKDTHKLSMEQANCTLDWEKRLKVDIDKRMVQMAKFHHQPYQVFGVSPILSNFEENLECCVTQVIERLVQYLELKTWTSKSQRSNLNFFEFTKLKDNINQETLEGPYVVRELTMYIGIMIAYMIILPEAIKILLQIVQGIIYLCEDNVCHCNFQIQSGFISRLISLPSTKDNVHVKLADFGLWKATYSKYSSNTNMGVIIYLPIELVERKNLMYSEIIKSMVPLHPSICVINLPMRIMSDYEGQPMSLPNDCPTILALMTTRWWSITSIDQLDPFVLLDQLKNLMQSTPMACFANHKSSHYMSTKRLHIAIACSSGHMLRSVITINGNDFDCHSLEGKWTWELNAELVGIKDEIILIKPWQPIVKSIESQSWTTLPMDIHEALLNKLPHEDLCQMKLVSKDLKVIIESDTYHASRGEACQIEASFSSLYFFIKDGAWQCAGYDYISQKWRRLPPLTCLPPPDEDLFKEYLVAGSNGLFCINVSKVPHEERLIVCNPLTQKNIELPPLRHRRNPVLLHIMVNPSTNSYKVIAAGSCGNGGGGLSKCTEVFDSLTWEWTKTGDMPGPEFCLNEYQTGVCIKNILYCIAFVDDGSGMAVSGKGVLAYDVDEGMWMPHWKCLLPSPTQHHTNSIAQLLECNGELYLFLEREHGRIVDHCIEKLESLFSNENVVGNWNNIIMESKTGGRGLLVYPEFTCVPHGDKHICIFNTIEHKGVVYNIVHGKKVKEIQPPPVHLGDGFHSLNPLSFTFHPNFMIKPSTCKQEQTKHHSC